MNALHPVIEAVANHYEFIVQYDNDLDKWMISYYWSFNKNFYWSGTNDVGNFLDEVKEFFKDIGYGGGY